MLDGGSAGVVSIVTKIRILKQITTDADCILR